MKREPVTSSAIVSLGYDASSETLEVEFTGGSVYRYDDVPESVYREFLAADSKGTFLNAHIKHAYSCARMTPRRSDGSFE